jgi:acyl-CoA oxidase
LSRIAHLFAHSLILDYSSWYLTQGLISIDTGKQLPVIYRALIKGLVPQSNHLVDALGVKPWLVFAPIGNDWAKYNVDDNRGELIRSRL